MKVSIKSAITGLFQHFGLSAKLLILAISLQSCQRNVPQQTEKPLEQIVARAPEAFDFPEDYLGQWQGKLHIYRGKALVDSVDMTLGIEALDSGRYTWDLRYGILGADARPYVLAKADSSGTHWQIDERNGIVLNAYDLGGVFYSCFEVMGSLLYTRDERRGEELHHEIISGPFRASSTGDLVLPKGDTIPKVNNYPLKSRQVAVLRRS